jgi:hypothetical protein
MANPKKHQCPACPAAFTRSGDRNRHYQKMHLNASLVHQCTLCGGIFASSYYLKQHHRTHQLTNSEFVILSKAFNKKCIIYRKTYSDKMNTLEEAFNQDVAEMTKVLEYEIAMKNSLKASIIFHAEFLKPLDATGAENSDTYVICLRTTTHHLCNKQEVDIFLQDARRNAQLRIDDFVEQGSGWVLNEILATDIEIGGCSPLNGSCNLISIDKLAQLKRIPAIDKSEQCFFQAIAFHYTKTMNKKRLDRFIQKHIDITIPTPVKVSDLKKFERDNPNLNLKINVIYSEEDDDLYPIYVSKNVDAKNNINLLLFKTIIAGNIVSHYTYINNLSTILRKTYRGKVSGKKGYQKAVFCPNCLCKFGSQIALSNHTIDCMKNKPQKTIIPEKGDVIQFEKFNRKFKVPYFGVFDFEAKQGKPENKCDTCAKKEDMECRHKTIIQSIQEPITYSLIILDNNNKIILSSTYSGNDCVEHMMNVLLTVEEKLLSQLKTTIPMKKLTRKQKQEKETALICNICEKELLDDRVIDHDHITGFYLGITHAACNLNRHVPKFIPIYCHNFEGYDSHFILQKMKKDERIRKVHGLPHNTERFKTITINSFVFLDSLAFVTASLSDLVDNLTSNPEQKFHILDQMGLYDTTNIDERKHLLLRKGVYCYEYVTSLNVLRETKKIPARKHFYSKLTANNISIEDYSHAKNVYSIFKCRDMLEYTELYCKSDVALLAEVIVQFRMEIMTNFGLDCW